MIRRSILILCAFASCLATGHAAAQAKWPERPVRLVVPYPPGGISDALGRMVGRSLEKDLGQPVVVENKPGAGSNIGSEFVAKSAPDGYTILLGSSANSVNMSLYRKLGYDTARDFAPVSLLADVPNVLVVNAAFPARSVAELVDMARKQPDELSFASAGSGSPAHLAAEQFNRLAGIKLRHIAYKGAGPAITDVMAGHVPIMFTNLSAVFGGIESGKLRLLAVGGKTRWPSFPDVPTVAEAGVPGYEASAWYGLMVPTGTPAAVTARLQQALAGVRTPDVLEAIRKQGAEPVVSPPEFLAARVAAELKAFATLVRETGITTE
ncbi:MAG: Bug family tripartite tricarboxylate transporter substrate binding protein [Lautropia sp.]